MAIIFTQIDIAARPEKIWQILTDFTAYPGWNPIIRRARPISGNPAQLHLDLHPPGQLELRFKVLITRKVALQYLSWQGFIGRPGFLNWVQDIEIEARPSGCIMRQTARLTGLSIKPIPNFMMMPTRNGFARMNEALRDKAEEISGYP